MLRETRGALLASGAADADASFEATAAVTLPRACRPVPPRSNAKTAADAPADLPAKAVGFASALAFGRAIPPAPPTEDGLTAPAAWHPSRPVLATVDGQGQVLIHHDAARTSMGTPADARAAPPPAAATVTALRHASHARARALAWRPRAAATLAVAGGDGVWLWSRDPGAAGAVGDATPASGGSTRASASAPPPWRVRRLPDDSDDAGFSFLGSGAENADPFRHAGVSTGLGDELLRAVAETARAAAAALARAANKKARDPDPGTERFRSDGFFAAFANRLRFANENESVFLSGASRHASPARGRVPAYDACAWSPDGRLLAAGSRDRSGVAVWEAATGARVAVASGARGVAALGFSDCGEYLFAAHANDGFTVWETEGWRCQFWGTEGRAVTAVAWGPRGGDARTSYRSLASRVAEKSFSGVTKNQSRNVEAPPRGAVALVAVEGGGARLSAVHFSRGAPSLVAQVLPVDLPRAVRTTGDAAAGGDDGKDAETDSASPDVVHASWDPSGRRLAVAFAAGNEAAKESGSVGLFSTRIQPVVRASLVGTITPGIESGGDEAAPPETRGGGPARVALLSGPGGAEGGRAPGDAAEAATTLAACWEGGGVSVVPVFA